MIVRDWRTARDEAVSRLYETETKRWQRDLHWDIASQWAAVETARATHQLPGFIAESPSGEVLGWSFHLLHRDALQVGALVADSPATTERLVDSILRSDEARTASSLMMFGYLDAPGLDGCLSPRGLTAERYRYLQKALPARQADSGARGRTFDHADTTAVTDLLVASYDAVDPLRPFAKTGRRDEWVEYVSQLTCGDGCGTFEPTMSPVSPCEFGGLDGAALVTRIAPGVAHLAQVAVHPVVRGRKIGSQLLRDVMAAAQRQGCDRLTLLVSERNEAAGRLYERLGFVQAAEFQSVGGPR